VLKSGAGACGGAWKEPLDFIVPAPCREVARGGDAVRRTRPNLAETKPNRKTTSTQRRRERRDKRREEQVSQNLRARREQSNGGLAPSTFRGSWGLFQSAGAATTLVENVRSRLGLGASQLRSEPRALAGGFPIREWTSETEPRLVRMSAGSGNFGGQRWR
jgi:hypothetical protein